MGLPRALEGREDVAIATEILPECEEQVGDVCAAEGTVLEATKALAQLGLGLATNHIGGRWSEPDAEFFELLPDGGDATEGHQR